MIAAMCARALVLPALVLAFVAGCGSSSSSGTGDAQVPAADAWPSELPWPEAGVHDASPQDAAVADAPAGADTGAVGAALDPVLAEKARAIAAEYQSWGRVDDELRWAPWLCRIPLPGRAYPSTSMDQTTHGQKLYSVFARKRDAYPAGPYADQAVVKESWLSEPVAGVAYEPEKFRPDGGDHFYPYATKDGAVYRAAARAGLYIMFKLDPATPNTDEGWVYATITADGQLTAAGRVDSCIGCHREATHDRLFGVAKAP
jgi:hypothetical protein